MNCSVANCHKPASESRMGASLWIPNSVGERTRPTKWAPYAHYAVLDARLCTKHTLMLYKMLKPVFGLAPFRIVR